jgi:hypothetical protein
MRLLRNRSLTLTVSFVGGALALAGTAGAASAARIGVDAGCYVVAGKFAPPMAYSGSGFGPHDTVLVASTDGTVDTSAKADSAGTIKGHTMAPDPYFAVPGVKHIRLTATDQTPTGATVTAHTTINVTVLGWEHGSTKPAKGLRPLTETTNWSFSGFLPGKTIFGHYLFDGEQVALARFGRAQAPCGTLKVRAPLYPATPHHTSFTVQYDNRRTYSRHARPQIIGELKLTG